MISLRLFVLLALLSLAGVEVQARRFTVGVIPRQSQSLFWRNFKVGADKAAEDLKAVGRNSASILWRGPMSEGEAGTQALILDNVSALRVDAILLAPASDEGFSSGMDAVAALGIPVVVVDSSLSHTGVVARVQIDHAAAGKAAAQQLAQAINGRGHVAILRFSTNNPATTLREAGFRDGLRAFPDIQLASFDELSGPSRKSARETAQKWLNDAEAKLDGIFCPNESTAEGMYDALKYKPSSHCKMVSCDITSDLAKGIGEGIISAAVVQDAKAYGQAAMESTLAILHKKPAGAAPTIPFKVINRDNVRQEEIVEWMGLAAK